MSTTGHLGADPDQLEQLAVRMAKAAESLEGMRDTVRSHLHAAGWSGRDGDQFRLEWHHTHTPRITVLATLLRESSQALRIQANQQRAASAGYSGMHSVGMAGATVMTTTLSSMGAVTLTAGMKGPSLLDTANFAASAALNIAGTLPRIRYYGAIGVLFSGTQTLLDVIDGMGTGWGDEQIGKVTIGVVGMGLGAAALVLSGPVGWAAVGAGVGLGALSTFPMVNEAVGGAVRGVGEFAQGVGNLGASFIDGAAEVIGGALQPVAAPLSLATNTIGSTVDTVGDFAAGAVDTAKNVFSSLNPFD